MTQGWVVFPVSIIYLGLLFLIAWYGDKRANWLARWRPWIYSLSIAVYCTSWTFYGTVGQASNNLWSFLPIYFAPILVFTLGWRILARIILTAKREHITSIADFIAARYGKSQGIAVLVTVIAVVGILPYIALQLRGITLGMAQVAPDLVVFDGDGASFSAGIVALALALFTMLFGTRHIDSTEHHRGMMMAVAFESVVKLVAFLVVGLFAFGMLAGLPSGILTQTMATPEHQVNWGQLIIHTLLTMAAMFCLPRQFHTIVVENNHAQDLHTARWVFPGYLILMGLFVVPLALVGQTLLPGISADTYVINLPLFAEQNSIAMLAFIGGTSAASGMVIVSTIALAIMVSNDLVLPLLLRRMRLGGDGSEKFAGWLLNIRRVLIGLLMLAAWGVYQALVEIPSLSSIGFLSFAAIAQFFPALIGGLYWRHGNRKGVYFGLIGGFAIWLITLMAQTQMLAGSSETNLLLWLLEPPALPLLTGLTYVDWGMVLSLLVNTLLFVAVSLMTRPSLSERLQAASFVGAPLADTESSSVYQSRVTVAELEILAGRFVGRPRAKQAFQNYSEQHGVELLPQQQANALLIRHTERVLAGVFGASSARLVLTSALQGRDMQLEEIATIVDEASELFDFSRGLLQGAIEHISQGIAVVDKQLRLVAWNQRYLQLFEFPPGLIQVGRPISDVIRHNAYRGLCGPGDPEEHVRKRVAYLEAGSAHTSSRLRPDGTVIEVQGNPMPGGGFVMSFTDITQFRQTADMLKEANETLEARVQARTKELESLNKRLVSATRNAEQMSQSKSRFLAAVSHDLMQPLNAARLFSSSLNEVANTDETRELAKYIESSLGAAEDLISDLLDVSRLESGKLTARVVAFPLSEVFDTLGAEFGVLARQQDIDFRVVTTDAVVCSDAKLLRRALQNFLTNAFRYNPKGKVLLGCRRRGDSVQIQIWDNGPGISEERQAEIFDEFTRGDVGQNTEHGLGLGLAIARGISRVLDHPLDMWSELEKGTMFSLFVPIGKVKATKVIQETPSAGALENLHVLCIDNEPDILVGMESLLSRWGCQVQTAETVQQVAAILTKGWRPHVVLSDYHLANEQTGLQALQQCRLALGNTFMGVLISADRTQETQDAAKANGYHFMSKPVKPIKLRNMLNQVEV
ncbi:PAS domain-containing hybrid sensor histidine kinase/response regulator [Thaumasiovibrio subtropicus]|uniref:PAS domain-containing hybrid sensor histidine kinase/response regulator n=1 Tax=Thaumasiovibrio subtropicus TaxID=1891207 RepID=UPI000B357869|nr:NahK/ErcS family hybrid sensor histidine kinase/response regulator [Thaumasiovibrio subtropicus]